MHYLFGEFFYFGAEVCIIRRLIARVLDVHQSTHTLAAVRTHSRGNDDRKCEVCSYSSRRLASGSELGGDKAA